MASIFESFRNSSMPKRLLRYALSRFDILDAETLDMGNLDLEWGMKTVLEFRDVGVKLKKLKRLLQLPPTFTIQKAKVTLLRVTLPVDIYSSPIQIEVSGVDVRLKISSREEGGGDQRRKRREKSSEASEIVPTAADLAQSFLEQQPSGEKKELEEALAAETQDLGASLAMSDCESDEDSQYGTGQALSLPAFLTDFLRGIVDRTQVRIEGVAFQLDVEVPVDPSSNTPELVTFQLSLEGMNVEGVTTQVQDEDGTPKIKPKDGKRHIALDNVRAFLISEANVFSTLARSPSMPSSASSPPRSRNPPSRATSSLSQSTDGAAASMADSGELSQSHYALQDSEDAFNIPYDFETSSEGTDNDDPEPPASSLSTPRASIYQDFGAHEFGAQANDHLPSHSAVVGTDEPLWGSLTREAQSEPALRNFGNPGNTGTEPAAASVHSGSGSGSSGSEPGSQPAEDLSQSHVFSHEEAESMYMSAFSQTESVRLRNAMPGGWDSEESSPETSPTKKQVDPTPVVQDTETSVVLEAPSVASEPVAPEHTDNPDEDGVTSEQSDEDSTGSGQPLPESIDGPDAQDEAATPRGPTRIVKEILSLKSISIYVPSNHQHIHVQNPSPLGKSVTPHLPGAFSVHSASVSGQQSVVLDAPERHIDESVEIILAPLEVRFDASIGFLLAMVVAELLESLKGQPQPKQESSAQRDREAPTPKTKDPLPEIKLTVEKISLLFLEKLTGVADTAERFFDPKTPEFSQDTLLQTVLENLTATMSTSNGSTETSIDLERFRFGYADADIVSFDRRIQMRASVRDAFPTLGDISVKLVQSPDVTRCKIVTLPLNVRLDLQRLDETFSWFGGLSSFLNMGSSMTSNTSQVGKSPTRPVAQQKARGVRFEAAPSLDDTFTTGDSKIDARVGGFRLELIGKDCSVALDTSAVKLVSRDEGIGVGLTKIRLSGPYLRNSRAEPPITAELYNTQLKYCMTPEHKHLERLLELITPSKVKFDDTDDVIMVDTLLRQRRKGPLLEFSLDEISVNVRNLAQLSCLPALGEEIARLGTVAKYLPEDDRPGLLTLGLVRKIELSADVGGRFGVIQASLKNFETAHISVPSLVAVAVGGVAVHRNQIEELVGSSTAASSGPTSQSPVLMMRMIGDDIEPVIKLKMRGLNIEYRVPTIMDVLDLAEDATPQDFEASLAASVANLGEQAHTAITGRGSDSSPVPRSSSASAGKPTTVDLAFSDCVIGLNPLGLTSKLDIALLDARLEVVLPQDDKVQAVAHFNKVSILLIDDASNISSKEVAFVPAHVQRPSGGGGGGALQPSRDIVTRLCARGFVDICQISSAKITVDVSTGDHGQKVVDVELRDDLLVLETCADSTQTLISLANALKPPTPPSKEVKFKTEVMPVKDLLASISLDAFGKAEGNYNFEDDFAVDEELGAEGELYEEESDPLVLSYPEHPGALGIEEKLFDAASMMDDQTVTGSMKDADSLDSDDLEIDENYFGTQPVVEGTAHRWNSAQNGYDKSNDVKVENAPLRLRVRDVHVIWNLFDGYDWQHTRDVISKAVHEVETKAYERTGRSRRRSGYDQDLEEEETVIGDFLFNSIYIGIPANHDPRELAQAINQEIYGETTAETESVATTTVTATTSSRVGGGHRFKPKKLKLNRSRHNKITFELVGVNADVVVFPPGSGETQTSVDVRVHDLDIFDRIPTSTWKKFATYDRDAGERPMDDNMVHLELLVVKPVPELAATELVLKVQMLPLRLHVDQDALDFITRFFEFKDDSAPTHMSPSDVPFIQRVEVMDIPVQLDFKPKRVDYAGLRSGHTTEFMNFMILDRSHMVLRHTIIYGISGFDRMGKTLNSIWMPDITRNQLPGVLAGLAPVRSLVTVGSGFKDLIEIPIQEYKRNGRIVRSISKGAAAFARSTGTELVKLGAKVATGTQYVLQGAEGVLVKKPEGRRGSSSWEEDDMSDEERKQISLYADQPTGVVQGLRHAYSSLARDLNIAKDAIIAVPAEVRGSTSATGAAKVVIKHAPTIIFRPAIGATKAIGQTLMGATNSLDPQNIRRMEDKYKSGPGRA